MTGRSPDGSGLRPFGAEPQDASQAKPLVPNAGDDGQLVPNAHLRLEELRQAAVSLIIAAEKDSVADWPEGIDYGELDKTWAAVDATYPTLWTPEQIEKLNEWQSCGHVHPFTCPNRGDSWHKNEDGEETTLEAIAQGWVCRSCGYRQFWAHDFMFNGPGPNPFTSGILTEGGDAEQAPGDSLSSPTGEAGDAQPSGSGPILPNKERP